MIFISCPKNPILTESFPNTFSAFNNKEPEPHAGSYTLFTVFLPTVPNLVKSSETSAGVKNSPPDFPAFEAYIVIKYSYASPNASIS